jgi:S-DNA-T family DNA segregation ATPase FtsK/SpoIIIE
MSLEKLTFKSLNDFKLSFQKEVSLYYQKKIDLEKLFLESQVKFNALLQIIDSDYKKAHKELTNQCEYLKAEVWRYKTLMEEFHKADTTPEMQKRILELENAVNEHCGFKIKKYTLKYEQSREIELNKSQKLLKEWEAKLEILDQEMTIKADAFVDNFHSFVRSHYENKKGTASSEALISFPIASYSSTSCEIRLGYQPKEIDLGIRKDVFNFPVIIDFQDKQNLILLYDDETKEVVESISDLLIFRVLVSNLPDKVKINLLDTGMYEKFREFLTMSTNVISKGVDYDYLLSSIEGLENNVRNKLALIWSDIHDSHQSIHEYNIKQIQKEQYDDIIPYHLYVIDQFQSILLKDSSSTLLERIAYLVNYGANFVFLFKTDKQDSIQLKTYLESASREKIQVIDLTGKFSSDVIAINQFQVDTLNNDDKKILINTFIQELKEVELNRSVLKFIDQVPKQKENWFNESASGQVKIPLGKSNGKDGLEYLYFKTKEGLSNAMLCGGVGSGKTNLLKTIISSVALNYSPEEVEMYLIDMKNGAGFSIFQAQQLPHVKLYAFSAENELIFDVFENLKREMDRRYTEYAKYNIDNLEDVYRDPALAKSAPKRTIVVIDEFASIYTNDDMYLDEISSNILNIAQKGRAMGINLLLATQNFSNIKVGTFHQAVTQIPTRILLKSSPDAAMSILGLSNTGYKDITRIGEGFINYNYGELNSEGGNNLFKSFLLDNHDLAPLLTEIREAVSERGISQPNSIFIDAAQPAYFKKNNLIREWLNTPASIEIFKKQGIPCFLGESFLMKTENVFSFTWRINAKSTNQNILISGNDREMNMQSLISIISSITYTVPEGQFSLKFLNPLEDEELAELGLKEVIDAMPLNSFEYFDNSNFEAVVSQLRVLLESRKENGERLPLIVILPAFEKFVQLQSSEYGLNALAEELQVLLSSGSTYGIYFICEVNKPSNISKISRDYIGCFEHRIAFFMNEEESDTMISSKLASKLIDTENTGLNSKGIYYAQSTQQASKFKSYVQLQLENDVLNSKLIDRQDPIVFSLLENTSGPINENNNEDESDYWSKLLNMVPDYATLSLDDKVEG